MAPVPGIGVGFIGKIDPVGIVTLGWVNPFEGTVMPVTGCSTPLPGIRTPELLTVPLGVGPAAVVPVEAVLVAGPPLPIPAPPLEVGVALPAEVAVDPELPLP